jgi:peroxiredoxin
VTYDSFLPQAGLGFTGVAKRSAFLIDRDGVIQYSEVLEDARELPNFDRIKSRLAEIK